MYLIKYVPSVIYFAIFIIVLEVVFSFGVQNIEDVNDEAMFTAIVTIFIFVFGFFIKSLDDIKKQNKSDKQLKRVFVWNLRTIIDGLRLQIDDFTKTIETLNSPTPDGVIISSYVELDYFEINKISSKDLFRVFIDNLKGDENEKIETLENLRKQLRFIENSQENIFVDFKELFNSFKKNGNQAINGIKELGEFFDSESTRLLNSNVDVNSDTWFIEFSELLGDIHSVLRTSNDTTTNFTKLEKQIIPKFIAFAKEKMEDKRTPIITSIFNKTITATYERKDTINNLVNMLDVYNSRYKEALILIESTLAIYDNTQNTKHNITHCSN